MKDGFETQFIPYDCKKCAGRGTALVLAPHPDDEVFGCGGAILSHVRNHDQVYVIIFTDGSLGDPALALKIKQKNAIQSDIEKYKLERECESINAGKILGYGEPIFLSFPDRGLDYNKKNILLLKEHIDKLKPSVVYSPSVHEMHPDHLALALLTINALQQSQITPDLYMYEIGRPILSPNFLLDISMFWETKKAGMNCFKTQLRTLPYVNYISSLNHFRTFTLPGNVVKAEAYFHIKGERINNFIWEEFLSKTELKKIKFLYPDQEFQIGNGVGK